MAADMGGSGRGFAVMVQSGLVGNGFGLLGSIASPPCR